MPSHPAYPSNSQLREESLAEALLAEQAEATLAFQRALAVFAAAFDAMHFPLGSPVKGYDVQDINGQLADWMIRPDDYADVAADAAQVA